MLQSDTCDAAWIFLTSVNNISPSQENLLKNPSVHAHSHAHTPPQAKRQIGGDFWPCKDYHNIMRETNLMRKPFPWPRSIPITHSSSTLSQNLLVHRAGQCSVEALGQPRLHKKKEKSLCCTMFPPAVADFFNYYYYSVNYIIIVIIFFY